jgi:hypothetical protein
LEIAPCPALVIPIAMLTPNLTQRKRFFTATIPETARS